MSLEKVEKDWEMSFLISFTSTILIILRRKPKMDYGKTQALDRRNRTPPLGYEHMVAPKVHKPPAEPHYNYGWE